MLTKKDFIRLADIMRAGFIENEINKGIGYSLMLDKLIAYCKEDNPNFNEETFKDAIFKDYKDIAKQLSYI